MMKKAKKAIVFTVLMGALGALAQKLPMNKETKKIEYTEATSVERAGVGEVVNRLYYWAQQEFTNDNVTIVRDDSTFKTLTIKGSRPMVKSVFGVNHIHTNRLLKFEIKFLADKKDYTYWINNLEYQCIQADRKREETQVSGPLEDFKGPAKRSLYEEIDEVCLSLIASFKAGAETELTKEQMDAMQKWQNQKASERKAAAEAAKQAAKEAEAAKRKAEKDAAAAAKEADAAAKAEAKAQQDAERQAAEEAEAAKRKAEKDAAAAAKEADAASRAEAKAQQDAEKAASEGHKEEGLPDRPMPEAPVDGQPASDDTEGAPEETPKEEVPAPTESENNTVEPEKQ